MSWIGWNCWFHSHKLSVYDMQKFHLCSYYSYFLCFLVLYCLTRSVQRHFSGFTYVETIWISIWRIFQFFQDFKIAKILFCEHLFEHKIKPKLLNQSPSLLSSTQMTKKLRLFSHWNKNLIVSLISWSNKTNCKKDHCYIMIVIRVIFSLNACCT